MKKAADKKRVKGIRKPGVWVDPMCTPVDTTKGL